MYVQLSIDNVIGRGALRQTPMSEARYVAFKEMAVALVEEFASASGWVDVTVERHEFHDEWSGVTSTKVAAFATEAVAHHRSLNFRERVASLAWQFSQESIHAVMQRYDHDIASAELIYSKDAPEAVRREVYVERQGGFNPWAVPVAMQPPGLVYDEDDDVYDALATLVDGEHEVEDGVTVVDRLRDLGRILEDVVERLTALEEEVTFDVDFSDDWWVPAEETEPAPFEIKVGSDDVAKARRIVQRVLSHPDADETTVDIFGKVLSLPAELSDGFTIVRSSTD